MADNHDLIISLQQFQFQPRFHWQNVFSLFLLHDWCLKRRANGQTTREGGMEKAISSVLHISCYPILVELQSRILAQIFSSLHTHTKTEAWRESAFLTALKLKHVRPASLDYETVLQSKMTNNASIVIISMLSALFFITSAKEEVTWQPVFVSLSVSKRTVINAIYRNF